MQVRINIINNINNRNMGLWLQNCSIPLMTWFENTDMYLSVNPAPETAGPSPFLWS